MSILISGLDTEYGDKVGQRLEQPPAEKTSTSEGETQEEALKPKEEAPKPKEEALKPKEPNLEDLGQDKQSLQDQLRRMSILMSDLGTEQELEQQMRYRHESPVNRRKSEPFRGDSPPRLPQLGSSVATPDQASTPSHPSRSPVGFCSQFEASSFEEKHTNFPPPLRLAAVTACTELPATAAVVSEQLHLNVVEATLSFKLAGVRRQAPLSMLRGPSVGGSRPSTLRLPSPSALSEGQTVMLGVGVLQPLVEEILVLHPDFSRYNLDLGIGPMGPVRLEFRVSGHGAYGSSVEEDKVMEEAAGSDAAIMVKGFLSQHKLMQYIPTLLQAVIREKPADPYTFMAQQLRFLSTEEPTSSAPDGAHLELLRAEGIPDGSLLSVRCGGDRRQALVSALLKDGLRLKLSKGLLVQAQILVPLVTVKVPLAGDKELYRTRLKSPNGSISHLTLRVQRGPPSMHGPTKSSACGSVGADSTGSGPETSDSEEYLVRHGILNFARQLMKELAESQPKEPFAFIAKRLEVRI